MNRSQRCAPRARLSKRSTVHSVTATIATARYGMARRGPAVASAVSPGTVETGFAALIAGLYSCDIIRILFAGEDGSGAMFRVVALTLYAITAFFLLPFTRTALQQALQSPFLTVLILLPLLSIAWSSSPSDTIVRSIMLIGSSLFGFYLAVRFPARALLRVYAMGAFGVAVLSLFLIIAVPSIGIEHKEPWIGAWNGAFLHKNGLGGNMALSCGLITLYLLDREARVAWWPYLALACCLFLLFASQSVTGQVTFVISVLAVIMIRNCLGLLRPILLPLTIVMLPMLVLPLIFLDGETFAELLTSLGRDVTLSGRVPLWNAVWPFIENRFWLGYGYEAFWVESQEAMRVIEVQAKFRAYYSHNGVLEIMLAIGAVGAMIFAVVFVQFLGRMISVVNRFPTELFSSMVVIFALTFIMRNISEVAILTRHDMAWCLFIALSLKLRGVIAAMRQADSAPSTRQTSSQRRPLSQGRTS
jgi:exopolysaccharide production protein ExoQ